MGVLLHQELCLSGLVLVSARAHEYDDPIILRARNGPLSNHEQGWTRRARKRKYKDKLLCYSLPNILILPLNRLNQWQVLLNESVLKKNRI